MDKRIIRIISGLLVLIVCIVVPMFVGYKFNDYLHKKRETEVISQFLSYGKDENTTEEIYIDLGGDSASEVGFQDATIEANTLNYVVTPTPTKPIATPTPNLAQEIDTTGVGVIEGDILYLDSLFKITYYCACKKCCGEYSYEVTGVMNKTASGTEPVEGRTIAVCRDQIPLGTTVVIDGHEYVAEDVGGAIKWNRIDIYVESHEKALQLGVKKDVRVGIKR